MKMTIKVCTCILLGFLCIVSNQLSADNVVPKYPIFHIDHSNVGHEDFVDNAVFMTLNKEVLQAIRKSQLEELNVVIPFENGQRLTLALKKESFLAEDFKIQIQHNNAISTLPYTPALFYGGKVKGVANTLVALNFFENEISGVFSLNGDNYNIGRYERGGEDSFVLYKEKNLDIPNPFECSTEDPESIQINTTSSSRSSNNNKVRLYVECDHFLYQNMDNNSQRVADFAAGLLNIVATIYRNESIELEISEIKIWSTPDPYPTTTAKTARNAFGSRLNGNFNGDIAHLISNYKKNGTPPNGGSANIDVLCNKPKAVSYTNITTSYLDFPTFSWTAYAITHEVGHNLGSAHTHSCLWPTGPIDNCWCPEGTCEQGPEPRASGTLMSYCHLDPNWTNECELSSTNPGIDFAAGFGPQPGDLIRSRINSSTCLTQSTGTTENPSNPTAPGNTEETPEFTAEVNVNDETCQGKNDGIITLTLKNGVAPYSFKWSNGGNTSRVYNVGAGTYSVTVTDAIGQTASGSVEVQPGVVLEVNAGFDQTISCQNQSVTLDGRRSISGAEYVNIWSKIGGTINGAANNSTLVVSEPGTYVYMVQNQNTGCYAADTVIVSGDTNASSLELSGGTITCNIPTVRLAASTNAINPTYAWTGPGVFSSTASNPQISTAGVYTLKLTNEYGCVTTKSIAIDAQTNIPSISALGGVLDCQTTSIQLTATSNQIVSYQWTGPNGFSSTDQNPITSVPGQYNLVVTSASACTNTSTAQVGESKAAPNFTIEAASLSCSQGSVQLQVLTNETFTSYNWTGPNGFSSTSKNPSISTEGQYTLSVTNSNGCKTTASTIVTGSTDLSNITATGGIISCLQDQVQLKVATSLSDLSYSWSGPNGFATTQKEPIVSASGIYTLLIQSPSGCRTTKLVVVEEGTLTPNINIQGGIITCIQPSVDLKISTNDEAATYNWTGPNGFTSNQKEVNVDQTGAYYITVTNSNGCASTVSHQVLSYMDRPSFEILAAPSTCAAQTTLSIDQANGIENYHWKGPNNFSSHEPNPTVQVAGAYILEASGFNGCVTTKAINVTLPTQGGNLSIIGDNLSCAKPSTILTANASERITAYNWKGPNGFDSNVAQPVISEPGTYSLNATTEGGCSINKAIVISASTDIPSLTLAADPLNCSTGNTTLRANTASFISTYAWTGPNGFESTERAPKVSDAGVYTLVAYGGNGCSTTNTIEVSAGFSATTIDLYVVDINCDQSGQLISQINGPYTNLKWTGPNNFISTNQNIIVSTSGTYQLEVIGENGCSIKKTAEVKANGIEIENISTQQDNCGAQEGSITISLKNPNDNYQVIWNTGQTGLSIDNLSAGTYSATIRNSAGCVMTVTETIRSNASIALNSLEVQEISCDGKADGAIKVTVIGGVAPYQLLWSNGVIGSVNSGLDRGLHSLEVVDATNCVRTFYFTLSNPEMEVTTAVIEDRAEIVVSGGQPAYTFAWNNGRNSAYETNLAQGSYTVTVTDNNGCQVLEHVTIQPKAEADAPLLLSPNPADNYFNIYYELEEAQYVFISIFNAQGHYLYRMTKFTDTVQETVSTSSWENGTYYVQILLKSKKISEELKVIHN